MGRGLRPGGVRPLPQDRQNAPTQHSGKGFFLQIEGASIDKQDHAAADPCG